MRSPQQKNRSRGRGGRKGGGGGNIINRVYDSAGPEGKVRGTPQQIIDKYLSLARDAQTTGDRVMAENFLQHAEHYQRLLMQAAAVQEQNRREQADAMGEFDGDGPDEMQPDRRPQHHPQQRHEPQESQGADEIGGMTMIDSGAGDDLLVVSEEIGQGLPRRNGDGRRRRQRHAPEGGQEGAPTDEQSQAPHEN